MEERRSDTSTPAGCGVVQSDPDHEDGDVRAYASLFSGI